VNSLDIRAGHHPPECGTGSQEKPNDTPGKGAGGTPRGIGG